MDRIEIRLYTRRDCRLCEEMKEVLLQVSRAYAVDLAELDIDQDPDLKARFDHEVPVLLIEGRKAFKYRTTEAELRKRLEQVLLSKETTGHPPSR
jgi:glutaredoxin